MTNRVLVPTGESSATQSYVGTRSMEGSPGERARGRDPKPFSIRPPDKFCGKCPKYISPLIYLRLSVWNTRWTHAVRIMWTCGPSDFVEFLMHFWWRTEEHTFVQFVASLIFNIYTKLKHNLLYQNMCSYFLVRMSGTSRPINITYLGTICQ